MVVGRKRGVRRNAVRVEFRVRLAVPNYAILS